MSKAVLFVAVPTVAAVVGLAVWNVQLSGELADVRRAQREAAAVERPAPPRDGATAAAPSRREEARTRALEDRVRTLEAQLTADTSAAPRAAPESAQPDAVAAELPDDLTSAAFGRAVNDVIDARNEANRRAKMEREAEKRAAKLLRGIDVTETQLADVTRVTLENLLERAAMRQGDDLAPEERRARMDELDGAWLRALGGVLDAAQLAEVETRLERKPKLGPGKVRNRDVKKPRGRNQADGS